MSRKLAALAARGILALTAGLISSETSLSQVVSLQGGVHVRAPFVRVDVFPGGGVSVRAPFAAVDVPGRPYYYEPGPFIGRQGMRAAFPSQNDLAAMDDQMLRQTLRSIAARLHERLGRFDTGDTWQRYLRVSDDVLDTSTADPAARQEAIANLLGRFEKIAADPQYPMISNLPAFRAMQSALIEASARFDGAHTEELPKPERPPRQP
jgi:hypothetical protein